MEVISIILLVLLAVVVSSAVARMAPDILPLPLVQIALGALIAKAFDFTIALDPEVFLLLFIAPLLFLDGWRIPKEGLFRDKWTIIALAFGLVLFTVVGAGLFIHWLIPAMPLAVAFALAAVLSPTDAVAVSAITARAPLPKRLMHIIEGESLLKDASGLVCLRFAIAAAVTGTFSLAWASATFVWLAIGGLAVGVILTLVANAAKDWISRRFGEETGAQILISVLIPFGAYLAAEHLAASGILAAVAAGVTMAYEERSGRALAVTRVRRAAVWDAMQYAANGAIFVLLGEQLPGIVAGAGRVIHQAGQHHPLWLLGYVAAVSLALAALRCFWTWATLSLLLLRHRRVMMPGWRIVGTATLAGVRGAVTLSAVMTLPLFVQDGSPLPARDLAILLAAGVIIVTLIAANVGLPYLAKDPRPTGESLHEQEKDAARLAAAHAAVRAVELDLREARAGSDDADLRVEAGARVLTLYRQMIEARTNGDDAQAMHRKDATERRLRLLALDAERRELRRMARTGKLTDESVRALVRELDLQETRFRL